MPYRMWVVPVVLCFLSACAGHQNDSEGEVPTQAESGDTPTLESPLADSPSGLTSESPSANESPDAAGSHASLPDAARLLLGDGDIDSWWDPDTDWHYAPQQSTKPRCTDLVRSFYEAGSAVDVATVHWQELYEFVAYSGHTVKVFESPATASGYMSHVRKVWAGCRAWKEGPSSPSFQTSGRLFHVPRVPGNTVGVQTISGEGEFAASTVYSLQRLGVVVSISEATFSGGRQTPAFIHSVRFARLASKSIGRALRG